MNDPHKQGIESHTKEYIQYDFIYIKFKKGKINLYCFGIHIKMDNYFSLKSRDYTKCHNTGFSLWGREGPVTSQGCRGSSWVLAVISFLTCAVFS